MEFRLADHGLVFSTRNRGKAMRADLLAHLAPAEAIAIDFDEVLSASYSFLDEFVSVLAEEIRPRRLALTNASETISETIERSLRRRGLDPKIAAPLATA